MQEGSRSAPEMGVSVTLTVQLLVASLQGRDERWESEGQVQPHPQSAQVSDRLKKENLQIKYELASQGREWHGKIVTVEIVNKPYNFLGHVGTSGLEGHSHGLTSASRLPCTDLEKLADEGRPTYFSKRGKNPVREGVTYD